MHGVEPKLFLVQEALMLPCAVGFWSLLPLLHFRNLTAFPGGAKELLLRDLDQLFLSSDCRHFNRTESLRYAQSVL